MMDIWYTWLAYLGLIGGLVAAAFFGWSALRAGLIGFVGGLAVVTVANAVAPLKAECLQETKGLDILRAYSIKCPSEEERREAARLVIELQRQKANQPAPEKDGVKR
jgi:hypothetical protein